MKFDFLLNYNFHSFYDLLLLKYQRIDNRFGDIYVFSHTETHFCTFSQ